MDSKAYERLQKDIYKTVMEKLDFGRDYSDREIAELIDDVIVLVSKSESMDISYRGRIKKGAEWLLIFMRKSNYLPFLPYVFSFFAISICTFLPLIFAFFMPCRISLTNSLGTSTKV